MGYDSNRGNFKIGGLLFVGCLFLCLGIGMFFGKPKVGLMVGMGIGFLVMAATRFRDRE